HLVAASIPELSEKDVTVGDQRGQLLSETDHDSELALANKQLDYTRNIEERYMARIAGILQSSVGDDGYRVQLSADVDFSQKEQTSESFNPDLPAVRSEQTLKEVVGGDGAAAGVPGALSNQPPGAVTVPETAQGAANQANAAATGNSRSQATRNFELDRTISHTRHQVGTVKRLTVAVVLDDKHTLVAGEGDKQEYKRQPISDAELER